MTGRLIAALRRSSRTTRRVTLAALVLVALLIVASALAPSPQRAHRPVPPPAGPARTRRTPAAPGSRTISPGRLVAARRVAGRFLAGYLPFLYGRGSARSIAGVTPGLRRQLIRVRGVVTPVDSKKGKRPHVAEGAYEPERVQVCAQALILEEAGYKVTRRDLVRRLARTGARGAR